MLANHARKIKIWKVYKRLRFLLEITKHPRRELVNPLRHSLGLHRLAGVIRRLHQAKTRRQRKCLIQAERAKHLLGDDVAAAVAGDDHGVKLLFIERIIDQHAGEPIDERKDIRAHAVVVVGAQEQERVALDKVADYVAARIGEKQVRYPQVPVEMGGEAWPESVKIAEAGGLY